MFTNSYDAVYKWFDYLKSKEHFIRGYVVMPNHLHVLIDLELRKKISIR
jgi:REP element-mobilizing transposase RayT